MKTISLEVDTVPYEDMLGNMLQKIAQQKDEILLKKLKDLLILNSIEGVSDLLNRRFPLLCMVKKGEWVYWFYNDGTKNGKFLIAFSEIIFEQVGGSLAYKSELNYRAKETYNGEADII